MIKQYETELLKMHLSQKSKKEQQAFIAQYKQLPEEDREIVLTELNSIYGVMSTKQPQGLSFQDGGMLANFIAQNTPDVFPNMSGDQIAAQLMEYDRPKLDSLAKVVAEKFNAGKPRGETIARRPLNVTIKEQEVYDNAFQDPVFRQKYIDAKEGTTLYWNGNPIKKHTIPGAKKVKKVETKYKTIKARNFQAGGRKESIRTLQESLNTLGYTPARSKMKSGKWDGVMGTGTTSALRKYAKDQGMSMKDAASFLLGEEDKNTQFISDAANWFIKNPKTKSTTKKAKTALAKLAKKNKPVEPVEPIEPIEPTIYDLIQDPLVMSARRVNKQAQDQVDTARELYEKGPVTVAMESLIPSTEVGSYNDRVQTSLQELYKTPEYQNSDIFTKLGMIAETDPLGMLTTGLTMGISMLPFTRTRVNPYDEVIEDIPTPTGLALPEPRRSRIGRSINNTGDLTIYEGQSPQRMRLNAGYQGGLPEGNRPFYLEGNPYHDNMQDFIDSAMEPAEQILSIKDLQNMRRQGANTLGSATRILNEDMKRLYKDALQKGFTGSLDEFKQWYASSYMYGGKKRK